MKFAYTSVLLGACAVHAAPRLHWRQVDAGNSTVAAASTGLSSGVGSIATITRASSVPLSTGSRIEPTKATQPAATQTPPISKDSGLHHGFNTTANPMFLATGNWTTVSCDASIFKQLPLADGPSMWAFEDGKDAVDQLMAAWNSPEAQAAFPGQTFSTFVWSVFNQTGGAFTQGSKANCQNVRDNICSNAIQCGQNGISPAGYAIVNSMVQMNQMYSMQDKAITDAFNSMNGLMTQMIRDFAPTPKNNDAIFEAVLGGLSAVLGLVTAGGLSTAINAVQTVVKVTEATTTTLKNVVSFGLTTSNLILSKIPAPKSPGDQTLDIQALLTAAINSLNAVVDGTLTGLASAQGPSNQALLTGLLNTGLLLQMSSNSSMLQSTQVAQTNQAVSILWGQMIPIAWSLSTQNLRPFILRMDVKDGACGKPNSDMSDLFSGDAIKSFWCDSLGNTFWLLNGINQNPCSGEAAGRGTCSRSRQMFGALPGLSKLDGTVYGGITTQAIIKSSYGGFMNNNKKNGYTIPTAPVGQVANDMSITGTSGLPMAGGITAPGFFNFTMCLDYKEARTTLASSSSSGAICGTVPSIGTSSTGLNAPGQFTPGWCGVHIVQYQKREGNQNLLNQYQVEVTIKDSAGLLVGTATKQPISAPLAIADSSLPYQLIVSTGNIDKDPVSFWYGDQYWDSTSKANHCSFGGYDSGTRQGDCGFTCNLPAGPPAVSATVAHKLPAAATPAAPGVTEIVNTYITPSPTPTPAAGSPPPPAPKPTYATGRCHVHVVQYQKHEGSTNPTGNYEIEATLFDGKGIPLSESGKVAAPAGKVIVVKGLVSDFDVTVGNIDNDPIAFSFAGQKFSSKGGCKVGGYDSGSRNMDCGFSC